MTENKSDSVTNNYGPAVHFEVSAESVKQVHLAIMKIISAPNVDERTKRAALDALGKLCAMNGATVSNCNFQTGS